MSSVQAPELSGDEPNDLTLNESEEEESVLHSPRTPSHDTLRANLAQQDLRKNQLSKELRNLRERIKEAGNADSCVERLVPLLRSLKILENKETVLRSNRDAERLQLEAEVSGLEEKLKFGFGLDGESLREDLDRLVDDSVQRLCSAKKELAGRLRSVLALRRRIDEVPTQAELIQYEQRFSELNAHIQKKHRQTRKYYDTYNTLLEIKEWMLKETSLLNSISSQFQDAITSAEGRMKLIDSMEGIVRTSQQKLQKVTVALQEEQKVCDALKKRYSVAMADQRHCYSLLKDFQEQRAKNERLRRHSKESDPAASCEMQDA